MAAVTFLGLAASLLHQDANPPVDELEPIVITGVLSADLDRANSADDNVIAIDGEEIDSRSARTLDEILGAVANITVAGGSLGPAIRGQDTTGQLNNLPAGLGGGRNRSTTDVDGRSLGYFEYISAEIPLWDVGEVSLVRGPLLLTLARPSIAGGIFIRTEDPQPGFEAGARLLLGSLDRVNGAAMVNIPLDENLGLSLRGSANVFKTRSTSDIDGAFVGADADHHRAAQYRLKLAAQPASASDLKIVATYARHDSLSPQADGIEPPFRERRNPNASYGIFEIITDSGTLEISGRHGAGDWAAQASIGHGDITRFAPASLGELEAEIDDRSLALAARFDLGGGTGLLVGGRIEDVRQNQTIDLRAIGFGVGAFDDLQRDQGVFGQLALKLAPQTDLHLGARYQQYRQRRSGALVGNTFLRPLDFDARDEALLPSLSLLHQFSPAWKAQLTLERGMQPGGATLVPFSGEQDEYMAEQMWHLEASLRGRPADNLEVRASLFHDWIEDAQRVLIEERTLASGLVLQVSRYNNAPRARVQGAELELEWKPWSNVMLQASGALLDTRVDAAILPSDPIIGNAFARSPPWSASLLALWNPADDWDISIAMRAHGPYFSDDLNSELFRIDSAALFDARVERRFERFELFAYARNIFDRFHLNYQPTVNFATAAPPRELGIGVSATF